MTKAQARRRLGVTSDYALAALLGVTRFAVSKWNKRAIPEARAKQIADMWPSLQEMRK